MGALSLRDALRRLGEAIQQVEEAVAAIEANHDPLASHIFVSRRQYRTANDTKAASGARARETRQTHSACRLGQVQYRAVVPVDDRAA